MWMSLIPCEIPALLVHFCSTGPDSVAILQFLVIVGGGPIMDLADSM
jgi:hypothetical protein